MYCICIVVALSSWLLVASLPAAENWPAWRGPDGQSVSQQESLPTAWGDGTNIRWKVSLGEAGNSSPIVWRDRVFLTQPVGNQRTLMCFDREQGKLLWQSGITYEEKEQTHRTNPYCSATPVTDGERVIAWFGSAGLYCYDFQGNLLWDVSLGKQTHTWGYGTSPILWKDLCILQFGPGETEFLIAVDKKTGKEVWKVPAPAPLGTAKEDPNNLRGNKVVGEGLLRGSWATPIVVQANGREELIVTWPEQAVAYDPASGEQFWKCEGLGGLVYSSPMYGENLIVCFGGYKSASIAVKPGGSGNVTETHRAWRIPQSKLYLGTGVIYEGHVYIHTMEGIAQCLDVKTGQPVWEARLTGGTNNASWSSILRHGDNLYVLNQSGTTFVFKANPEKFELVSKNKLDERTNSSLAASNGQLFVRTHEHLYCIGNSE